MADYTLGSQKHIDKIRCSSVVDISMFCDNPYYTLAFIANKMLSLWDPVHWLDENSAGKLEVRVLEFHTVSPTVMEHKQLKMFYVLSNPIVQRDF